MKFKKIFNKIQHLYNSQKVSNTICHTTSIASKIVPFATKPTLVNGVLMLSSIVEYIAEQNKIYSEVYFLNSDWECFDVPLFKDLILEISKNKPSELLKTFDTNESFVKIINLDDNVKLGISFYSKSHKPDIYYSFGKYDCIKNLINEYIWEKYNNQPLYFKFKNKLLISKNDDENSSMTLEPDTLVNAFPSEKATILAQKFQKAFDVGENRSLFLFGPPGSGKSTLARQIVKELGYRSFRVNVSDLYHNAQSMFDIIDVLKPDCIIFDDFDRCQDVSILLDLIAFIRKEVKLLIATANSRDNVDEAILRPERFDEIEFIDTIDENVIKITLGEYSDDLYDQVKDWPIVYITELKRRLKWLSKEEAKESLFDLAKRVKRVSKYNDFNDDMQVILNKNQVNNDPNFQTDDMIDQEIDSIIGFTKVTSARKPLHKTKRRRSIAKSLIRY